MSQDHTNPFVDVTDCPICQRGEPCTTNESLINATLRAENDRLRRELEDLPKAIPTNWCDPLLTGPDAVMKSEYDCRDIEALLRGVQDRLRVNVEKALEAK